MSQHISPYLPLTSQQTTRHSSHPTDYRPWQLFAAEGKHRKVARATTTLDLHPNSVQRHDFRTIPASSPNTHGSLLRHPLHHLPQQTAPAMMITRTAAVVRHPRLLCRSVCRRVYVSGYGTCLCPRVRAYIRKRVYACAVTVELCGNCTKLRISIADELGDLQCNYTIFPPCRKNYNLSFEIYAYTRRACLRVHMCAHLVCVYVSVGKQT